MVSDAELDPQKLKNELEKTILLLGHGSDEAVRILRELSEKALKINTKDFELHLYILKTIIACAVSYNRTLHIEALKGCRS